MKCPKTPNSRSLLRIDCSGSTRVWTPETAGRVFNVYFTCLNLIAYCRNIWFMANNNIAKKKVVIDGRKGSSSGSVRGLC